MEKYEKYVRGSYSIQQPPPLPLFEHRGYNTAQPPQQNTTIASNTTKYNNIKTK